MFQLRRREYNIAPSEKLFFRYPKDAFDDGGKIRNSMLAAPDQSANRSGWFGRSWYVLIPDPPLPGNEQRREKSLCMGIMAVIAPAVELTFTRDGSPEKFRFTAVHDPQPHNYHHCEIRMFVNEVRLTNAEAKALKGPAKKRLDFAKQEWRDRLREAYENNRTMWQVVEPDA